MEATAEVKLLVGLPLDKVLFLSGKVLALVDVAKLVADLLCVRLSQLYSALTLTFHVSHISLSWVLSPHASSLSPPLKLASSSPSSLPLGACLSCWVGFMYL